MKKGNGFNPTEIIFAATQNCNLHCRHCFVSREPQKLSSEDAIRFMKSAKNSQIYKIGFSGGEPFLHLSFMTDVIKAAVQMEFCFDQIMTNGDWWKTPEELRQTLCQIRDAGYDGKIGLSYDSFHNQDFERNKIFCKTVNDIFDEENLTVQTVIDETLSDQESDLLEKQLDILYKDYIADIFIIPQTFLSENPKAWKSKKWFKEDFCQGPGQILFVHSSGNIAPCCGFANENPTLFIGNIKEHDFQKVIENAASSKLVQICYTKGLSSLTKKAKKIGIKGKTSEICTFCDAVCKNVSSFLD